MRKIHFSAIIAAVFIFCFCYPYFVWDLYKLQSPFLLIKVLLFFIFLRNLDLTNHDSKVLFGFFLIILFLMPISIGGNFMGVVASLLLCTIPFSKESFAKRTYNCFLLIYTIIIGISGIVWLLSFSGVIHPWGAIAPLNVFKPYNYNVFPFLVKYNGFSEISRFSGPFDEPGVVGTLSVLLLTIGNFNVKDKRYLVVFLTGLLSLSLFYYIGIAILLIFKIKGINKKKGLLVIALLFIFVLLTLNNDIIYDHLWRRFEWDSDTGSFNGDNRIGEAGMDIFGQIVRSREFFFGTKDFAYFEELLEQRASIFLSILHYGVIFVAIYIGIFLYYGWSFKNEMSKYIVFVLILLGSLFQRPFFFNPEFLFLFSMMARTCRNNSEHLI